VKAEWEGQPRHRDPIFARDGWRCAVSACARQHLHDHHILFRSRAGTTDATIASRCARGTIFGEHGGRVHLGEAPDAITWELGMRAGRQPLLGLEGDRYVAC